jgi:hypothetical protein
MFARLAIPPVSSVSGSRNSNEPPRTSATGTCAYQKLLISHNRGAESKTLHFAPDKQAISIEAVPPFKPSRGSYQTVSNCELCERGNWDYSNPCAARVRWEAVSNP